ncbi:MAG: hypothetical protein IPG10_09035 [Flavobacteriales bacterium]|nr:hypothetical protein [Flavobacteriales bacterium]MBK6752156.1 hypothetical protein [Flavobacteriales bacterium]MBK7269059.1 hypothetical protein [Flavobacteriales bacterium]MBK7752386.1 hypothetical protein [Flavobacteriales bacterium]MBK9075362.1 hypothetical protein [Flavobacteriales bacterium]
MNVRVEVCATSFEEATTAERLGVDTVEICSWLSCGGVTPGPGLVRVLRERMRIPIRVLVRCHGGGFNYSAPEKDVMLADMRHLSAVPGCAVVFGALDGRGDLEGGFLSAVLDVVGDKELTFHRAIDQSRDPQALLEQLAELGVPRVLTSGGETLAVNGAARLRSMQRGAEGRLQLAMAGGINASNVVQLVEATGIAEVHFSAQKASSVPAHRTAMGSGGASFAPECDVEKIEGVLNALVKAGLR